MKFRTPLRGAIIACNASFLLGSSTLASAADNANIASASVYEGFIQPMFDAHCVVCHGPEKKKAGLRLDGYGALRAGGPATATTDDR